jgi:hypothetical protein
VIAEPIKRLGRYTFADRANAKFNSRGIQVAARSARWSSPSSTDPQMVGAGALCTPLLGLPHWAGVVIVGVVVLLIVVTAGHGQLRRGCSSSRARCCDLLRGADGRDPGARVRDSPRRATS